MQGAQAHGKATVLLILTLVAVASCSHRQLAMVEKVSEVAAEESDERQITTRFWSAVFSRNYKEAADLASYPFDMDAYNKCIEDRAEMITVLSRDKSAQGEIEIVLGEARPITAEKHGLEKRWTRKIENFLRPDAKCTMSPDEQEKNGIVLKYHFVDFTVNGESCGALTRLRCRESKCLVAGVDN